MRNWIAGRVQGTRYLISVSWVKSIVRVTNKDSSSTWPSVGSVLSRPIQEDTSPHPAHRHLNPCTKIILNGLKTAFVSYKNKCVCHHVVHQRARNYYKYAFNILAFHVAIWTIQTATAPLRLHESTRPFPRVGTAADRRPRTWHKGAEPDTLHLKVAQLVKDQNTVLTKVTLSFWFWALLWKLSSCQGQQAKTQRKITLNDKSFFITQFNILRKKLRKKIVWVFIMVIYSCHQVRSYRYT